MFISCSNENVETNDLKASQITEETPMIKSSNTIMKTHSDYLVDNLILLVTNSTQNTKGILNLLSKNDRKKLNSNFQDKLKLCKTENDIADLFEKSNITNSVEILRLISKQQLIFKEFKEKNPSYYKMDLASRNELMIDAFYKSNPIKVMTNISIGKTTDDGRRSCAEAYNQGAAAAWVGYTLAMGGVASQVGGSSVSIFTAVGILGQAAAVSFVYVEAIAALEDTYQDCIETNCGKKRLLSKYN
jgi:hypothetical protein